MLAKSHTCAVPRGVGQQATPRCGMFGAVRLARLCSSVILVVLVPPAAAVPAAVTREFQAGVDAYRLGKYDDARAHLEKAAAGDAKLPGPHRFLAAVAQAQHRWPDCITETRRALQLNPHSSEAGETRKLHEDCRASDGRAAYHGELGDGAAIAVTSNVPGATVKIAGLRYGGTPVDPRQIKPGTLQAELDKPGYKPATATVEALPGIVTDIAAELEPIPPTKR